MINKFTCNILNYDILYLKINDLYLILSPPHICGRPLRKSKAPVIFIFWRTYWQGKPYKVVFASRPFGIAQGRLQRRGRGIPFINIRALQG